jgi:hypothetical protein
LKERLTDLSDAIKTAVCGSCGCLATPKSIGKAIRCNNCNQECRLDEPGAFGQITIPYAFSLLRHLIAGLNIELRFAFGEQDYIIAETDVMETGEEEIELGGGEEEPEDEDEENEGDDLEDDDEDYGDEGGY